MGLAPSPVLKKKPCTNSTYPHGAPAAADGERSRARFKEEFSVTATRDDQTGADPSGSAVLQEQTSPKARGGTREEKHRRQEGIYCREVSV